MSAPDCHQAATRQLLRDLAAEAKELQQAAGGSITDTVAGWLASQYASAAHEKLDGAAGGQRWEILRAFVQDWTLLRRGDQAAARLLLDREQLDWERANGKLQKEKEFREWIRRPEVREEFLPKNKGGITPETLAKIERELNLL